MLNATDVKRWVQPIPDRADGIASVALDAPATCVVSGYATGTISPDCFAPTAVVVIGLEVSIVLDVGALLAPNTDGAAIIEYDNAAPANRPPLNLGLGLIELDCKADTRAAMDGYGYVVPFVENEFEPRLDATAVVEMYDYGWGSPPVFPFKFPTRFTDNVLNVQDAAALVRFDCTSFDGGAGGEVVATVGITARTGLTLLGNLPVFPWSLPIVFNDHADVNVGLARLPAFEGLSPIVAECTGSVVVPEFEGDGQTFKQTMFPFVFPSIFWAPWQDGFAEIAFDNTAPAIAVLGSLDNVTILIPGRVEVEQVGRAEFGLNCFADVETVVSGVATLELIGYGLQVVSWLASAVVSINVDQNIILPSGIVSTETVGRATFSLSTSNDLAAAPIASATLGITSDSYGIEVIGNADATIPMSAPCAVVTTTEAPASAFMRDTEYPNFPYLFPITFGEKQLGTTQAAGTGLATIEMIEDDSFVEVLEGFATITVDTAPQEVITSGFCEASAGITVPSVVVTVVTAYAPIVFDSIENYVRILGSASSTIDIVAPGELAAIPVLGSATVEGVEYDFSYGSAPVFPFVFPARFTPPPYNIIVSGVRADAPAEIAAPFSTTVPQTGLSQIAIDNTAVNAPAVDGVASMLGIESDAITVDVVVFPFRFPAMFIPAYGNPPVLPATLPILFS